MSHSVKILQPSGIFDGIRGGELRREINEAINVGVDIFLIDLKNVDFMDSSGLGSLVSAKKIVATAGGKLFLCSVKDEVRMLFELTRMDKVFEKFADQDEFRLQMLAIQ